MEQSPSATTFDQTILRDPVSTDVPNEPTEPDTASRQLVIAFTKSEDWRSLSGYVVSEGSFGMRPDLVIQQGRTTESPTYIVEAKTSTYHNIPEVRQHEYLTEEEFASVFKWLHETWKKEVRLFSSASEITEHPAYLAMIGLGDRSIRYMLDDLRKSFDHWTNALRRLTGHRLPPDVAPNAASIRKAWLDWAENRKESHDP